MQELCRRSDLKRPDMLHALSEEASEQNGDKTINSLMRQNNYKVRNCRIQGQFQSPFKQTHCTIFSTVNIRLTIAQ